MPVRPCCRLCSAQPQVIMGTWMLCSGGSVQREDLQERVERSQITAFVLRKQAFLCMNSTMLLEAHSTQRCGVSLKRCAAASRWGGLHSVQVENSPAPGAISNSQAQLRL